MVGPVKLTNLLLSNSNANSKMHRMGLMIPDEEKCNSLNSRPPGVVRCQWSEAGMHFSSSLRSSFCYSPGSKCTQSVSFWQASHSSQATHSAHQRSREGKSLGHSWGTQYHNKANSSTSQSCWILCFTPKWAGHQGWWDVGVKSSPTLSQCCVRHKAKYKQRNIP